MFNPLNTKRRLTYLLTYFMEQSRSWEADWFCSSSRNSTHFMEPQSSLPYSQAPAICPYPEPTPLYVYTTENIPENCAMNKEAG